MSNDPDTSSNAPSVPRRPQLFVRRGAEIVEAPRDDVQLAERYPAWPDKGALVDGRRLTLLTEKTAYRPGEEIRVVHAVETTTPGYALYIAGPKAVHGEYVDGKLATTLPPNPDDPLVPLDYDGVTLPGPAVDFNYDVTTYALTTPGPHTICWKLAALESNTLEISIVAAP